MISILEELGMLLDIAEGNVSDTNGLQNLQEKIVSKKALRRKRRAQRKAAQLKAQQTKEQETQQPQEQENQQSTELTTQENTSPENLEGKIEDNGQLVVYDENVQATFVHSKQFLAIMQALMSLAQTWGQKWDASCNKFKARGDQGATPEIIDELQNLLDEIDHGINQIVKNQIVLNSKELYVEEVDYLTNVLEAMGSAIEKFQQFVDTLHAEDLVDDNTIAQLDAKLDNALVPQEDEEEVEAEEDDQTLIKWDQVAGGLQGPMQIWVATRNSLNEISKMPWAQFITKVGKGLVGWFPEQIVKIITSKVAKDAFKALFYSNPLTAMIWNGDFGEINPIKDIVNGVKDLYKSMQQKKEDEDKYNQYGLPEDITNWNFNKLKAFYYANYTFVNLVNLSYVHKDVDLKDKRILYQNTTSLQKLFEKQDGTRDQIVKELTAVIECLNKICKYNKWSNETIIKTILTNYNKMTGIKKNNAEQLKQIKKAPDEEEEKQKQAQNNQDALKKLGVMNDAGEIDQNMVDALAGLLNKK